MCPLPFSLCGRTVVVWFAPERQPAQSSLGSKLPCVRTLLSEPGYGPASSEQETGLPDGTSAQKEIRTTLAG